jgi:hypothetical protein
VSLHHPGETTSDDCFQDKVGRVDWRRGEQRWERVRVVEHGDRQKTDRGGRNNGRNPLRASY